MSSSLPRAVLFHLDDTIISAYSEPGAAWNHVAIELAHEIAPLSAAEAVQAITRFAREYWGNPMQHAAGRLDMRGARREIVSGALARLAAEDRPTLAAEVGLRLADRFTAYRDEQMKLFPSAHETIDALRARGVKLALVTNGGAEAQRSKIARFELAARFDHIQIEGEVGFGKPDERAYLHALQTLGVAAADSWMVGDNLEWEIAAPQRLGFYTIWHDPLGDGLPPGSSVRPDRIIRDLAELIA